MNKRLLSLVLVLALALGLVACGKQTSVEDDLGTEVSNTETQNTDAGDAGETSGQDDQQAAAEPEVELTYDEMSAKLYDENLGEFYAAYQKANDANSVSERYALMAIA